MGENGEAGVAERVGDYLIGLSDRLSRASVRLRNRARARMGKPYLVSLDGPEVEAFNERFRMIMGVDMAKDEDCAAVVVRAQCACGKWTTVELEETPVCFDCAVGP